MPVETIAWKDGCIRIIDQTRLPQNLVHLDIREIPALADAVRELKIRGAPAIGIAAAMGMALAAWNFSGKDAEKMARAVREAGSILASTRPTAVNLFWAVGRMEKRLARDLHGGVDKIRSGLVEEALLILEEDRSTCRQMGRNGAALLPDPAAVVTLCNAGALATSDFGTALGVVYAAAESGKRVQVFACETRPLLQGARLTSWELRQSGIDVTVICDSAAAHVMKTQKVDCILVGADRIAANGDAANKIGTYGLAIAARAHRIPFYVAAPVSTIDPATPTGAEIPIEHRPAREISESFGVRTVPENASVLNPAFDVTPHEFITGIITEKGVLYPPFDEAIAGKIISD
ncbi:S-methyl-5-thioribose-1-phosphate isomerase [bacterium]|nr:S-methyl-5-thioribose-1-phosphate isomerase [bacterium]